MREACETWDEVGKMEDLVQRGVGKRRRGEREEREDGMAEGCVSKLKKVRKTGGRGEGRVFVRLRIAPEGSARGGATRPGCVMGERVRNGKGGGAKGVNGGEESLSSEDLFADKHVLGATQVRTRPPRQRTPSVKVRLSGRNERAATPRSSSGGRHGHAAVQTGRKGEKRSRSPTLRGDSEDASGVAREASPEVDAKEPVGTGCSPGSGKVGDARVGKRGAGKKDVTGPSPGRLPHRAELKKRRRLASPDARVGCAPRASTESADASTGASAGGGAVEQEVTRNLSEVFGERKKGAEVSSRAMQDMSPARVELSEGKRMGNSSIEARAAFDTCPMRGIVIPDSDDLEVDIPDMPEIPETPEPDVKICDMERSDAKVKEPSPTSLQEAKRRYSPDRQMHAKANGHSHAEPSDSTASTKKCTHACSPGNSPTLMKAASASEGGYTPRRPSRDPRLKVSPVTNEKAPRRFISSIPAATQRDILAKCRKGFPRSSDTITVCVLGLADDESDFVSELIELLGGQVVSDFRGMQPFCVITGVDAGTRKLSHRNMPMSTALACRVPIVGISWIVQCVEAGAWLETFEFEAVSTHRKSGPGVLSGVVATFEDIFFGHSKLNRCRRDIHYLIVSAGGRVIDTESVMNIAEKDSNIRLHIHILDEAVHGVQRQGDIAPNGKVPTEIVTLAWISECLFSGECPPPSHSSSATLSPYAERQTQTRSLRVN